MVAEAGYTVYNTRCAVVVAADAVGRMSPRSPIRLTAYNVHCTLLPVIDLIDVVSVCSRPSALLVISLFASVSLSCLSLVEITSFVKFDRRRCVLIRC